MTIILEPADNLRLNNLCGPFNENIKLLEQRLNISIHHRDNLFSVTGEETTVKWGCSALQLLYDETLNKGHYAIISPEDVYLAIKEASIALQQQDKNVASSNNNIHIATKRLSIKPRTANQHKYLENILTHDITFGIGPAGSGKTYLAVAAAVDAFEKQLVNRIVLTRPAVEAGEKLGFLPGDLSQKVDPYLRPLFDALFEMLGTERVEKLIERQFIEIAPLAYMRGRTLNNAFIILDEGQNTTVEQMKMFLTRIGFNSKAVITGDITQIDLPKIQLSGLKHTIQVLSTIPDISFNYLYSEDVVRHPLVAKIVDAYAVWDEQQDPKRTLHTQRAVEKNTSLHNNNDISTN